jgi:hypothetical protein
VKASVSIISTAFWTGFATVIVQLISAAQPHAAAATEHVTNDNATIETLVEGKGPPIVLLPSLGRASRAASCRRGSYRIAAIIPVAHTD